MPLNANEEALLGRPDAADVNHDHQRLEYAPGEWSKIGKWTLVALILNRIIGSGIFRTPHVVLAGTGCVGGALLLWTLGGIVALCGVYVWLECGLSMPQRRVRGEHEPRGVPRSGGEKNYVEFMFPDSNLRLPHIRTTCSFSIMFLLMYNLSGNAMGFGLQVLTASGLFNPDVDDTPSRGATIGIAIGVLSLVVLLHTFSRRGGLLVNNMFAIIKVGLLLAIICLGIAKAGGAFGGSGHVIRNNFTRDVFKTNRSDVASWADSLASCIYAYAGFEQPFYVLAETKSPRKHFPKYNVLAMMIAIVLYVLVNIAYLLVVDKYDVLPKTLADTPGGTDMATLFFDNLFDGNHERAVRAMAAIIAISIFGNLWVMTYTAARVKQEIAKEGILPWSLYIAAAYRTPYGLWKKWVSRRTLSEDEVETAPTVAFGLHWCTSVLLVVVVSPIQDPRKAYSVLVQLYSYTIVILTGCWVSIGLVKIKLRKEKWHWQERRRYRPWLSPAHVIIWGIATAFMLIGAFLPPTYGSPYHYPSVASIPWYIIPAVGLTAPFWGVLWYWGLLAYEWKIGRHLVVTREAYWMRDPDCPSEYVQQAEIIDHTWQITPRHDMSEEFATPQAPMSETKDSFVTRQRQVVDSDISSDIEEGRSGTLGSWSASRSTPVRGGGARRFSDSFGS